MSKFYTRIKTIISKKARINSKEEKLNAIHAEEIKSAITEIELRDR